MDSTSLILILVSTVIGVLIGLLVSGLKKPLVEASPPSLSDSPTPQKPPKPGLRVAGTIWENEKRELFLQLGDSVVKLEKFIQKEKSSPTDDAPVSASEESQISPQPAEEGESQVDLLSIVGQVDDILQKKLANSPLSKKGIRLKEDPQKGMVIWVGLDFYEGIEEVPVEIRGVIKASIREWEKETEMA